MKQQTFDKNPGFRDHSLRSEHGGGLRKGLRKLARPFSTKLSQHVTLRSSRAKGNWSFLKKRNEKAIYNLVYMYGARFDVQVYRYANAGNHLHLLLKAKSKSDFQSFLRTIAGVIPRHVTAARKGHATGKFWDAPAYSKLVAWGRQFKNASNYIFKNSLEAFGLLPPRKQARGHVKIDYEMNYVEIFGG